MCQACNAIPAQTPHVSPTLQKYHGAGFSALVVSLSLVLCAVKTGF